MLPLNIDPYLVDAVSVVIAALFGTGILCVVGLWVADVMARNTHYGRHRMERDEIRRDAETDCNSGAWA